MAVYKPTLCYPFLNGVDIRVGRYGQATGDEQLQQLIKYLTCKVDTSNKNITGYKIRILGNDNQQIFPSPTSVYADYISPIEELQEPEFGYEENGTNSGINGTSLRIPFFQSEYNKTLDTKFHSYNAVYYSSSFLADHILLDSTLSLRASPTHSLTDMENVFQWSYDSGTDTLRYRWSSESIEERRKNAILLDGELLMKNDIVVAASSYADQRSGLWIADQEEVVVDGVPCISTFLRRYASIGFGATATIIKGRDFHNTAWIYYSYSFNNTPSCWYDVDGVAIDGLDCKDSIYKWEITLYQGNYDSIQIGVGGARYVTYQNVEPEWLDMTLSSGKILGSTGERVHLGRSFDGEYVLPEGTSTEPLVLQGTYMAYSAAQQQPTSIMGGSSRVYVKTYDSSFGHVYPLDNALSNGAADAARYCQFFKYSNNPDDILDTDLVDYAYENNVTFKFYSLTNGTWTSYETNEASWLANVSILDRYIVMDGTPDPSIQPGGLILFTKQTAPKQNGVYQYFTLLNGSTTMHCIKRAASFDTWGEYIGKVIFPLCGTRKNWQCLASGGAYTLWNPLSTTTGSSSLYFTEERPVLLFPSKIDYNHFFTFFDTANEVSGTIGDTVYISTSTIDGVRPEVGSTVLTKNGYFGTITMISGPIYVLHVEGALANGDYFRVENGQNLASLVFKWGSITHWTTPTAVASDADWDLFTSEVLHNTLTRTFISPWTGLQKGMYLSLLNSKTVTFSAGSSLPTNWIRVNDFNDKVFFIDHNELTTPLLSFGSTDESVPWHYDIRYFFRTSDENPFYSYESPYIRLYKNGELYSDLAMVGSAYDYTVSDPQVEDVYHQFLVREQGSSAYQQFVVNCFLSQATISGRSVNLSADYVQFGQSSWECYEWILYDHEMNVLQDTGRRYDKNIAVSFFGLANDGLTPKVYVIELRVENDHGDIISYVLTLQVVPGSVASFIQDGGNFTATADCKTQSVLLELSDWPEDEAYSIYRREYGVFQKPGRTVTGYYCPIDYADITKRGKFYQDPWYYSVMVKNASYVYKDLSTGILYQYNPQYGVDSEYEWEFTPTTNFKTYVGEWEPVLVNASQEKFRDFNVKNHKTYQYIIYPGDAQQLEFSLEETAQQTFANFSGRIWHEQTVPGQGEMAMGNRDNAATNGEPVRLNWQAWSITELVPEENNLDIPIVKRKYRVDPDSVWLFKYALETGEQTQNFSRNEFQTLGQFPQMGYGAENYSSGSVSAMLGSELVPASATGYVERLSSSRVKPLSTNENAEMLKRWEAFCFSHNPKLLKDIKGQSWIVQVVSNGSSNQNFVPGQPSTISFQWKQIGSTDGAIIYSEYSDVDKAISKTYGTQEWKPVF